MLGGEVAVGKGVSGVSFVAFVAFVSLVAFRAGVAFVAFVAFVTFVAFVAFDLERRQLRFCKVVVGESVAFVAFVALQAYQPFGFCAGVAVLLRQSIGGQIVALEARLAGLRVVGLYPPLHKCGVRRVEMLGQVGKLGIFAVDLVQRADQPQPVDLRVRTLDRQRQRRRRVGGRLCRKVELRL